MATRYAIGNPSLAQQSDDELVELARRTGNDDGAYEELYRRHETAARSVARHIMRSRQDADDVVNEAFAGVIAAIGNGAGPRSNFRQYLMACVRNSCKARRWSGASVCTDPSVMERSGPVFEDPDRLSEQGLVASAFSSLSPDWQLTLWLTAVEERPAAEVAARLGRRPNAVAALAHRAREAFAEAYLAQHQARNTSPACAKISAKLPHYVRNNCGDVDAVLVERHLVNCVPCSRAVDELRDVNAALRTLTGPAPLMGAGAAAAGAGAAMVAGFAPIATSLGGWSLGAITGGSLVKAAVIGVLLVPTAAIVSTDAGTSGPQRASHTAQAIAADAGTKTVAAGSAGAAAVSASEAPAGGNATDVISAAANDASGTATRAVTGLVGNITDSVPPADLSSTMTSVLPGAIDGSTPVSVSVSSVPSGGAIGAAATLPAGGSASAGIGADSTGAVIAVDATVPLVTVSLSGTVSAPAGSGGLATPQISTAPAVLPDLGLGLPQVTVPGVTIPSVTLLPTATTSPTTTSPTNTTTPITLPPVTLPPLVIASLFG